MSRGTSWARPSGPGAGSSPRSAAASRSSSASRKSPEAGPRADGEDRVAAVLAQGDDVQVPHRPPSVPEPLRRARQSSGCGCRITSDRAWTGSTAADDRTRASDAAPGRAPARGLGRLRHAQRDEPQPRDETAVGEHLEGAPLCRRRRAHPGGPPSRTVTTQSAAGQVAHRAPVAVDEHRDLQAGRCRSSTGPADARSGVRQTLAAGDARRTPDVRAVSRARRSASSARLATGRAPSLARRRRATSRSLDTTTQRPSAAARRATSSAQDVVGRLPRPAEQQPDTAGGDRSTGTRAPSSPAPSNTTVSSTPVRAARAPSAASSRPRWASSGCSP